jgi:hypothetical protein
LLYSEKKKNKILGENSRKPSFIFELLKHLPVRICLLTSLLFLYFFSSAQFSETAGNLQDPASGTYFRDGMDPFSSISNAACNARLSQRILALSAEKMYGFHSLNQLSFSLAVPVSSGSWIGRLNYFGFNQYAETKLGVCYARMLGSKADLGLQFNYLQLKIPGYSFRSAIHSQLGFRYLLNQNLVVGWSVSNPLGIMHIRGSSSKIPIVFRIGLGYKISEMTGIAAELIKEEDKVPNIAVAIRYRPLPVWEIRGGIHSASRQFFINAVLCKNKWRYLTGLKWHQDLGFSPSVVWHYFF